MQSFKNRDVFLSLFFIHFYWFVVPKKDDVRICVDLTKLNESVRRERHEMPSVEYTLGQLSDARIFSKLDANSGFWQVPLADESALLTTFITPFGRFCFKRLPFGISSAPEHFQRRMSAILEGIDGVLCQMDDILIFGATQSQHDERIREVLRRLQKENVTLNSKKCQFSVQEVRVYKLCMTTFRVNVRKYNQLFVNFIIVSCALLIVNIYPKSGHA